MNVTERLAAFAVRADARTLDPELADLLRLHVFDTVGALLAGSAVQETFDVRYLFEDAGGNGQALAPGPNVRSTLQTAVLLACVAARCSEIDDIHLPSCVTPGAVVVPAALACATWQPNAIDDADFLSACLAGYEVMVRFGAAIDGARILYRGVWPTYLATGFGVATVAGRLLGLDAEALTEALAIVATRATGTSGRIVGKTSRWLTLGLAAHDAVVAVLATARGFRGDRTLLDGRWSEITGIALDTGRLLDGLGERWHLAETSFKPIASAKQAIAAIAAFRTLLEAGIDPAAMREILIEVAPPYRAMIDRVEFPAGRQESLGSVRYQLALAAFEPAGLYDVVRALPVDRPELRALMARVRVVADPALEAHFPAAYPARVTVLDEDGDVRTVEMIAPEGDPGSGYDWFAAEYKMVRAVDVRNAPVLAFEDACRNLGAGTLPRLLELIAGETPAL